MKYLPQNATPDQVAKYLRGLFEDKIPRDKCEGFFCTVWELSKVVQEQASVSFKEAELAIQSHFPELYAEFWFDK